MEWALKLLHTLRYLRWEQIIYRPIRVAQYRAYNAFPRLAANRRASQPPQPATKPVETFRSILNKYFVHLDPPFEEIEPRLNDLIDGRFTFLNRRLDLNPIDWNRRYENHLWNYHLHYFDYALWSARAFAERNDRRALEACRKLIESWIDEARIGRSDGWAAYPTSLRVVNWIYAYALIAEGYDDREFLQRWAGAIGRQLDFLSRHLEFHLLANHLLKNVKALAIGGLFFNRESWLLKGERLLWREFEEQVLEDGGHYERSPMYHAQALGDFLECYALLKAFNRISNPEAVETKLRAMTGFLKAMSNPDGTLALFNDSANTETTRPQPIFAASERIAGRDDNPPARSFPRTGYYIWVSRDEKEKIIVDAGPPAADYNTAHAHCDLFSYELRIDDKPFIVDSGLHGYAGDRFREYCRSTRAHNAVMFDGREQSEAWGTFRMARRAKLLGAEVNVVEATWSFRGEYSPYYDSKLIHERLIRREPNGEWRCEDRLVSGAAERAASFIHLHPSVRAARKGHAVECFVGQIKATIEPFDEECVKIFEAEESPIQGWYFPDFGIAQPSQTICFEYRVQAGRPFGYRIKRI
jgi:uncharacterized heparinase superfamily protein